VNDGPVRVEARDDEARLVELMMAYQAGRLDAFEQLYLALAADLQRYLGIVSRDASVAQDLVQDTFMEIHRSRRTYLPPRPVRPWVFGIARNVYRRHRRGSARRARHEDRAAALADDRASAATASTSTPGRVQPSDIVDAVARLPDTRRDAWLLHHVHGLSFQEIATRLRIGAGAAKLRSSRAMQTIRTMLGIERNTPGERGGRDD
jgi:RNA polymerase sigma-70 factor, ECF subfamily